MSDIKLFETLGGKTYAFTSEVKKKKRGIVRIHQRRMLELKDDFVNYTPGVKTSSLPRGLVGNLKMSSV